MIDRVAGAAFGVITLPIRLATRVATGLFGGTATNLETAPEQTPEARAPRKRSAGGQRDTSPKPLDDVTLARKVEQAAAVRA